MIFPLSGQLAPLTLSRRRATAFSPISLSPALWLKADTGVYTDAGKTTPAGNGDAVYVWADQSGHGRDAVQATSGRRPTLATAAVNGHNAVAFNPISLNFLVSNFGGTLTQPNTEFLVLDITGAAGTQVFAEGAGGSIGNSIFIDNGFFGSYAGAEITGSVAVSHPNPYVVLSATFNGGSSLIRKNGADHATGNVGADPASSSLNIGLRTGDTVPFGGHMAELIFFNALLSGPQIAQVEAYLNGLYNVY